MSSDMTIKEKIFHELLLADEPLVADEIARRIKHSRTSTNVRLTELRKEKRIVFLGRTVGWEVADKQPPGSIAKRK